MLEVSPTFTLNFNHKFSPFAALFGGLLKVMKDTISGFDVCICLLIFKLLIYHVLIIL